MNNKNTRLFFYLGAAVFVPYVYLFSVRPYLLKLEENLDSKITNINEKDLKNMKRKLDDMKIHKKEE